jgi:uncharacterized protein YjiS (DUF1127 family)
MAQLTSFAPHVAGSTFGQVIVDSFNDMKVRRALRAEYQRTLNTLSAMTDRDLADIGISRLVIRDVAYQAAYGK